MLVNNTVMSSEGYFTRTQSPTIAPTAFLPVKRSETIFRERDLPEGLNINVRTASEKTLIFFLPDNDINSYDAAKLLVHVDSFDHSFTPQEVDSSLILNRYLQLGQTREDCSEW